MIKFVSETEKQTSVFFTKISQKMKKNHFLIFLFFVLVQNSYAQDRFQYGFPVGLRQSFVSGIEQANGSVTNWQFGAKLIFLLKNRFSLQILPNVNTQGWTDEAPSIH